MTENIKQFIANLNITRVSYNMAYPLFEGKSVNKDTGDIEDSTTSDLCFAKVTPNSNLYVFLGGKTGDSWISSDSDSKYYIDTYFFDGDFNLLSYNDTTLSLYGNYLAKYISTPNSCVYVLQRVKKGYQRYVVITDLYTGWIGKPYMANVNMDYVWGQAVLNYNYETETLKPYSLPLHIRKANVDDTISYSANSNTI